ncbi:MAG: aldehyde dehydrogenase family protein [Hyphomicrobiales bacterium]
MNYKDILQNQQKFFATATTLDIGYRIKQLKKLRQLIIKNESRIFKALKQDLKRAKTESYGSEIAPLINEIDFFIKKLPQLAKEKKVRTPLIVSPAKAFQKPVPYGQVLIISPWNFPFDLSLTPLIGAIASGNTVILKPSEYSTASSALIEEMFSNTFANDYITIINGGVDVTTELLKLDFNYIFFIGSTRVGKIVLKAASENLIPTSLELGGKSPCIVDKDANIEVSAKRIAWGKSLNSGQACVSPDYLMVHTSVHDKLIEELKKAFDSLYPNLSEKTKDYSSLINEHHFDRLNSLIDEDKVVYGNLKSKEHLFMSPTIIDNASWDDEIMQDEIFGPLLPVLTFDNFSEMINDLKSRPKPLASYYFGHNKEKQNKLIDEFLTGAICFNDTISHTMNRYLPFGGVGDSGHGKYRFKASFETFSFYKSVQKRSLMEFSLRYPPYKKKYQLIRRFFRFLSK